MKNLRKMTKLKSEKMRIALRVVALVLLVGANAVMLQAQNKPAGKNTREEDKGYYMNKYVNEDGNMLTLESYVTGKVISVNTEVPMDVTLVMDVSSSMEDKFTSGTYDGKKRIEALKDAATTFVNITYQHAIDHPDEHGVANNHRISLVKFADDYNTNADDLTEGNHYKTSWPYRCYAEVMKNYRKVSDYKDELNTSINSLGKGGNTNTDKGLHKAKLLVQQPGGNEYKAVILFTDGYCDETYPGSWSESSGATNPACGIANRSIGDEAKVMKDLGYKVYVIGLFSTIPAPSTYKTNTSARFLCYVSSDSPNAKKMSDKWADTYGGNNGYTYFVNSGEGLVAAFETVFQKIKEEASGADVEWKEETVVQDVISEYFQLPAGTTESDIAVKTANCTGINDGQLVFDTPVPMANPIVEITNGNTIRVSNFNFSDNWCGNHSATDTDYQGKKLIIEIPIEPDPDAPIGTHPTNGSGSGIYPNGEEHLIDSFPFPKTYIIGTTWVEHITNDPGVEDIKLVNGEYEIYSEEGLAWFISIVNGYNGMPGNATAKAKLMADIDASAYLWVPIGGCGYCKNVLTQGGIEFAYTYPKNKDGFKGTFDGQGHVIRGLNNIDPITMPQCGMFGKVDGGTVKNTFVVGCQAVGAVGTEANSPATQLCTGTEGHFGIIADTLCGGGTIFNCEAEGIIMTYDTISNMFKDTPAVPLYQNPKKAYTAGLVGIVTGGSTVHSCISVASLLGYNMGGIAYQVEAGSKVQNCYSYALFNNWFPTIGSNLGGLVAVNNGNVQNCYLRNRADETKTVHVNFPEINFTGIYGAVDAAEIVRTDETPWHKGLLIGQNAGSAQYMYIPEAWNGCGAIDTHNTAVCFVGFESSNAAQNVGWFTDAVTPYLYKHNDTKINMIDERETSGRLLQTLNNWANANSCTPWMRTTANGINNDYPVLKIAGLQSVASDDAIVLFYGDVNLNKNTRTLMTNANDDGVICLYENAEVVGPNNGKTLYINEDVAISQTADLEAYVGITLDNSAGASGVNSDHGFAADAIDWHMFATSLSNAPLGINYNGDTQNWPFEYGHPTGMPYYSFYDESEQDGYFPSKTFGTDGTDGIDYYSDWDFYCWDEKYQHYINFKRNSNSHWYEGAPQQIAYTNESKLVQGKGYMLAIANETFLQSYGTLNNGTVTRDVTYHENPFCPGYNLIGNPYQSYLDFDAFAELNGLDGYVILDEDKANLGFYVQYPKDGTVDPDLQYINMHQGFFIKVAGDQTLTFNNEMRKLTATANTHFRGEGKQAYPYLRLFVKETDGCGDYTTIEFNRPELGGGEKFMDLRTGNAQIYVHNGETNYSTLFATSDIDEVSVRFNTLEDGTFTLSWQLSEGDFNEMYLIDNINGQKTDMLTHNNYKFEGHAADYASRFNVVFHLDGDNNSESDVEPVESFAFQMDGNLIVNGMGTCQVFDLTGRLVSTNQLTDTQNTVALPQTAGIYMVRLVNGSSVKVQKLVVE